MARTQPSVPAPDPGPAPGIDGGVVLLQWPADRARAQTLTARGVPHLLMVDSDAPAPVCLDPLEDWIRLPADDRDFAARLNALRARAGHSVAASRAELDGNGRLLRGGRWVALSPIEEQLCALLLARFGEVVPDRTLIQAWPTGEVSPVGLRLQITRLRRRIAELELEVCCVRRQGYVLQDMVASPDP